MNSQSTDARLKRDRRRRFTGRVFSNRIKRPNEPAAKGLFLKHVISNERALAHLQSITRDGAVPTMQSKHRPLLE